MHRDRDISIFNMAFYREENVIVGVLIDFDLATYPEEVFITVDDRNPRRIDGHQAGTYEDWSRSDCDLQWGPNTEKWSRSFRNHAIYGNRDT